MSNGLPITDWVLDKVITAPAENLAPEAAAAYFVFAPLWVGPLALGSYAADEVNHYVVEPVGAVAEAVAEALGDLFGDEDKPGSPSDETVPEDRGPLDDTHEWPQSVPGDEDVCTPDDPDASPGYDHSPGGSSQPSGGTSNHQ